MKFKKSVSFVLTLCMVLSLFATFVIPVSAEPTNLVAGSSNYTTSQLFRQDETYAWNPESPITYPDEDGKSLTDGVKEAANFWDAAWVGFSARCPEYQEIEHSYVTFDLGAVCEISSIVLYTFADSASGIAAPYWVNYCVSEDGENWSEIGYVDNGAGDLVITFEKEASARFVKVKIYEYGWCFLSEVEIYGTAPVVEDDVLTWEDGWINDPADTNPNDGQNLKFDNAYGYTFVLDADKVIGGEDNVIITNVDDYNACNPNWAISVLLVPTEVEGIYAASGVVSVTPGSAANGIAGGMNFDNGNIVLVAHSSASYDGGYANWTSKLCALALKEGDLVRVSETEAYVLIPNVDEVPEAPEAGVELPENLTLWGSGNDISVLTNGTTGVGEIVSWESGVGELFGISNSVLDASEYSFTVVFDETGLDTVTVYALDFLGGYVPLPESVVVVVNDVEYETVITPNEDGIATIVADLGETVVASAVTVKAVMGASPYDGPIFNMFSEVAVSEENPAIGWAPEELPEGATGLDIYGYTHAHLNYVMYVDADMTLGELTAKYYGSAKDLNYFKVIVVNEDGTVAATYLDIDRNTNPASVKTDIAVEAGQIVLALSANAVNVGRHEIADTVNVGDIVTLYNVKFDAEVNSELTEGGFTVEAEEDDTLTVEEAIALGESKEHNTYTEEKYYVTGVITKVYNETYGNMYIADENGNTITVYGTYSADGELRYDAMEVKPVAGDTVTVYGIVGQYNGNAQLKNAWITNIVVGDHEEEPEVVEPEADSVLSIEDAIALGESKDHNTYTAGKYYVTGVIAEVYNDTYGNMYITDENGNTITVYGTYSADGELRYDAMEVKPVAGDTVTVYGIIGQYNGNAQLKNAWITEHVPATPEVAYPEGYTVVSGENGKWQSTEGDFEFAYNWVIDGETLVVNVIVTDDLVSVAETTSSANGIGTNVRLWINYGAEKWDALYDGFILNDVVSIYSKTSAGVVGTEGTIALADNTFTFTLPLAEVSGGNEEFQFTICVSNTDADGNNNACLYAPCDTFAWSAWDSANAHTVTWEVTETPEAGVELPENLTLWGSGNDISVLTNGTTGVGEIVSWESGVGELFGISNSVLDASEYSFTVVFDETEFNTVTVYALDFLGGYVPLPESVVIVVNGTEYDTVITPNEDGIATIVADLDEAVTASAVTVKAVMGASPYDGPVFNMYSEVAVSLVEAPALNEVDGGELPSGRGFPVTVPANTALSYVANFANGADFILNDTSVAVLVNGVALEGEWGYEAKLVAGDVVTFVNTGAEEITVYPMAFPVVYGTMSNPIVLDELGDITANINEDIVMDSGAVHYLYTATANGTLTITMPEGNWTYTVNNLTAGLYGDSQWSDSDPVLSTYSIEVTAGDEIQIIVGTYNPESMWDIPVGELTFNAAFEANVVVSQVVENFNHADWNTGINTFHAAYIFTDAEIYAGVGMEWWYHASFAPTANGGYIVVEVAAPGSDAAKNNTLTIPEGGFVWVAWTSSEEGYGASSGAYAKAIMSGLKAGDIVLFNGLDIANCTTTADASATVLAPAADMDLLVSHNYNYSWHCFETQIITNTIADAEGNYLVKAGDAPNMAGYVQDDDILYIVENVGGAYLVTGVVGGKDAILATEIPEGGFLYYVTSNCTGYEALCHGELIGKYLLLGEIDLNTAFAIDTQKGNPAKVMQAVSGFGKGDVNLNGEIDATDYAILRKLVLGTITAEDLGDVAYGVADVNGDGKVNARDYYLVKRAFLGTYVIPGWEVEEDEAE